jgi:hypothetical protein
MKQFLCGLAAVIWMYASFTIPIAAHEQWSNGDPVPTWVKASCCGPEDVHHLTASQVHAMADGWHVDGYRQVIAYGREFPSQDGDYWIFYRDFGDGKQTPVFCFFAPAQGY